jgi:hypothetical protein
MKNLVVLSILVLMSTKILSQDITFFFQNLPDSSLLGLSKEERKKIVKEQSEDTMVLIGYNSFRFIAKDQKFAYLIGSFDGLVSLKIWEISNGNKLIAVLGQNGTVGVCYTDFNFYIYDGKNFNYLNNEDVFLNEDFEQNFFKGENEQNIILSQEEPIFFRCTTYSLSSESSSIDVSYFLCDEYKKYKKSGLIGNKMELIWNDGKFTPGKVYWSE